MKLKKFFTTITFIFILFIIITGDLNAQCALCKAVAENSTTSTNGTNGLNAGILYIMSMPYLLMALITLFYRKKILHFLKQLFN
ncbi:MAG: hypothetical protein ABEH43_05650 [Flavobacteriales bacterium]